MAESPRGALLLALVLPLSSCEESGPRHAAPGPSPLFRTLRGAEVGIDFVLKRGAGGRKHLMEIMVGGVSAFDADADGLLDLHFSQGEPLPHCPDAGRPYLDQMYRNVGGLRFHNVTHESGAQDAGYTFSTAPADYDGDGDIDLYFSNFRENTLLANDGRGCFTTVPEGAGLAGNEWTVQACFVDVDRDADLDVYVANYVVYDLTQERWCGKKGDPEYRSYCHPDEFEGERDRLYLNEGPGDGAWRFRDVTPDAGLWESTGKALAVVPVDYDDDGDQDLYVANDAVANFLWQNSGDGTFREVAFEVGVAQNADGQNESCMGSDAVDVDGDLDFDLFSANLSAETNTLWINEGGYFIDDTALSGLAQDSRIWVGFGARFFDPDLDGDPDLMVANGHVLDNIQLYDAHETFRQPAQLYENLGRGKFRLKAGAGDYFQEVHVGRGLLSADLDNDGDVDAVLTNIDEGPVLLENTRNDQGQDARWIGLELGAPAPNTQALGSRVWVEAGGRTQVFEIRVAASYASACDPRLTVGLGDALRVERVRARWPDGTEQSWSGLDTGRYHALRQGE